MIGVFERTRALPARAYAAAPGQRRTTIIWFLLVTTTLDWSGVNALVRLPGFVEQLLTGALTMLVIALLVQRNLRLKLDFDYFLSSYVVLFVVSLVPFLAGYAGLGSVARSFRFGLVVVAGLLLVESTGERRFSLLDAHYNVVAFLSTFSLLSIPLSPSRAFAEAGRLNGIVLPMAATRLGAVGGVTAGLAVLRCSDAARRRQRDILFVAIGIAVVLLTNTRTALIAFAVSVVFSLVVLARRVPRVRGILALSGVLISVMPLLFSQYAQRWFNRGQSASELTSLTGRRVTWNLVLDFKRTTMQRYFGLGLSNKTVFGRAIDNGWLAIFHTQGFIGIGIVAVLLLVLLGKVGFERDPLARSIALFLVCYSLVSSYSETGIGDVSFYFLGLLAVDAMVRSRRTTPSASSYAD